jgi:hypothetical protein
MGPGEDNPQRRNKARRSARTEISIAMLEIIDEVVYKLY